jgi:hypothetical protein
MYIIEQRYGNDGYAFWFKMLELLGSTSGHFLDTSKIDVWEFLLARARVDEAKGAEILDRLAHLEAIDKELWEENRVIWVQNLVDNLADVYRKRSVAVPVKPSFRAGNSPETENGVVMDAGNPTKSEIYRVSAPETGVCGAEVQQRIGQDRIGQDRTGNSAGVFEIKNQPASPLPRIPASPDIPLPEDFNPNHVTSDTRLPPTIQSEWDKLLTTLYPDPNEIVKGRNAAIKIFLKSPERWRILQNAAHYAATADYLRGFKITLDKFVRGAYRDYEKNIGPLGDAVAGKKETSRTDERKEDMQKLQEHLAEVASGKVSVRPRDRLEFETVVDYEAKRAAGLLPMVRDG